MKKRNTKVSNIVEEDEEEPQKWYQQITDDPKTFSPVTEQLLIELKDEAKKCHDSEVLNYNTKNSKTNSNFQWMKTVMHKGTVSDRIAAHTVAIQDNPVCNLETLRNLVGMVKVGKKKECFAVVETLTELFLSYLLKPNVKLKAFHQRPLSKLNDLSSGNAVTRRRLLSFWYFEDQLKEVYTSYVLALNAAAQDSVDANKEKAITGMYKLLAGNPEQEQNLLKYIVNKLGDPSPKIASKTIYCLSQLLTKHSNMQEVVLVEIEKLLFRPNISSRAQYYSLCFLSQFYLCHEAADVARRLIEVYFSFFKACVKTGDVDSRMMSALLMGLNRAFPYAKIENKKIAEHIDTMYRLVHLANFNISLQALTLLFQVSDFGNKISDRFYSALYRKLADSRLLVTTHQAMLLSLIYKALLKDSEINRIKMFIKRLLQISLFTLPNFSCGILYLINQLLNKKENLLSLSYKPSFHELIEDDSDGEEKYFDVKESDEENKSDKAKSEEETDVKPDVKNLDQFITGSWCHKNLNKNFEHKPVIKYTPFCRNPLHGGGEFSIYAELIFLKDHFHPTVSLFAKNILEGQTIKYPGDPLKDFTLIRFLDRFVFKNPKQVEEKGATKLFAKRKFYKPKGIKGRAVNSMEYLKEDEKNIPVDELFLHKFLQKRYEQRQMKAEDDEESDLESVQSEEFEEMLDKMSGAKFEEDIDYLNEIGNLKANKKDKRKKKNQEDDIGSDLDDFNEEEDNNILSEDDLNEDEFETGGGEEAEDEDSLDLEDDDDIDLSEDIDDDDEDIVFSDDEELNNKMKQKLKKNKSLNSLFASADEFASILEEEGSSKIAPGSSNAFANKDKADAKQLAWEEKRNQWLHGYNKAVSGKKGKFDKKRKGNSTLPKLNKRKKI